MQRLTALIKKQILKYMTNLMLTKELSNYDFWQLQKYGNIIPSINNTPDNEMYESGIAELDRISGYIETKSELQLEQNL